MILFRCESVYQLLNAINMKYSTLKDETADLMLTDSTDFSFCCQALAKSGLFRKIFLSPDNITKNREFSRMSPKDQKRLIRFPEKYIYDIGCNDKYSDIYIPTANNVYTKLLYYAMVREGRKPRVHVFEDGINSYLQNIHEKIVNDILDHDWIKKSDRFENNIEDIYLYEPDLCFAGTENITIHKIPKINAEDNNIKELLLGIFGSNPLPNEKYIFLEEGFVKDRFVATDIQVLDYISDIVGKENIIVKMHPRSDIDRFTPRGYKLIKKSVIPWEMTLLGSNLNEKVFLTVSSTSAISAPLVMNKNCYSIMLFKLMTINKPYHVRLEAFSSYFKKLNEILNSQGRYLFCPKSMLEIQVMLRYIEGRMEAHE